MMQKEEVNYYFEKCLLTLNKDFNDIQKNLDDHMDKSLKWCSQMKSILKNETLKTKNSLKRDGIVPPEIPPAKDLSNQRITRGTSTYINNVINIATQIHIANESVSGRTRGALKSLQNSLLAAGNITCHQPETRENRGRSRIRRTNLQNETIVVKRNAEEGVLDFDFMSKKIKQEKFSIIESRPMSDDVFKKPMPRLRKPKKAKESILEKDTAVEESISFAAVLHSSPNTNTNGNTFLVSPKNLSVIPKSPRSLAVDKSPKETIEPSTTATSNSNDFIDDFKAETPKLGKTLTNEVDDRRASNEETWNSKTVRKNSKNTNRNFEDIEKAPSSTSAHDINDKTNQRIGLVITEESAYSSNSQEKEEVIQESNEKETENGEEAIEDKIESRNNEALPSSKFNSETSPEKLRCGSGRSGRVIRETRSFKAAQEVEPIRIKVEPEIPNDSGAIQDLNSTSVVKATKRTKPVLKSRIFDSKGNILVSVKNEKNSMKMNSPEKPYSLRSSSSIRENILKKGMITPDTTDAVQPLRKQQSCERRSNAENEPQVKRTKKTKRTKINKTEAGENNEDQGRVTRTKSKEAKQALEEAVVRKSGVMELARKSLNKAKLIALQKELPKASQALAARLAHRKRQISMSKVNGGSRDDLLGSSNKLSTLLMKSTVNFGSQVKASKIQSLKSTESLMSTGKGKYLNLYTDLKEKYITPGKRCHSPDVLIKSTTKITKEDEIEKELKLKALKEKEEEAQMKRDMAIKMRQKELKEKNEMKLQSAMKRKQLEMEKYNSKIRLEKEKEEKRILLLREREITMKEKARLKKEMMEQKLAETEERRRMEEEARIAKLKEQEAEQQRLMLEKQKELERHEKRAQERLAEQKARENYEMKLKTEQMLREKQQQLAAQSANKAAIRKGNQVKHWNYKPRNENDLGLDDEESDLDSENESGTSKSNKPIPKWAQGVMNKENRVKCYIRREAMMEYMKCHQKTPDIHKMFKMTPNKRIKRTSSAIWNTPSS